MIIDDRKSGNAEQEPAKPTPVSPAPQSGAPLDALLQIMLRREARQAAEEEAKQQSAAAKQKQRQLNAESNFEDDKSKQAKCTHLKGGRNRIRTQAKDYAVYLHRFVDNEQVIRCQLCGAKWKSKDTTEYLMRYGKQVPNHTGIGWREALTMVAESSNKPSSSEIPLSATPRTQVQQPAPSLIEN